MAAPYLAPLLREAAGKIGEKLGDYITEITHTATPPRGAEVIKTFCDGCGHEFGTHGRGDQPALTIERTNGMVGGGMPPGKAHLCENCGPVFWASMPKKMPVVSPTQVTHHPI